MDGKPTDAAQSYPRPLMGRGLRPFVMRRRDGNLVIGYCVRV